MTMTETHHKNLDAKQRLYEIYSTNNVTANFHILRNVLTSRKTTPSVIIS